MRLNKNVPRDTAPWTLGLLKKSGKYVQKARVSFKLLEEIQRAKKAEPKMKEGSPDTAKHSLYKVGIHSVCMHGGTVIASGSLFCMNCNIAGKKEVATSRH